MFRLLADENFNGDIVRGQRLRVAGLDLMRVQDCGLRGASDPEVLDWAANEDRVVLSHDRATIPRHACDRIGADMAMPGVFILNDRLPVGDAIRELELVVQCTEQTEWHARVAYLPL